MLLGALGSIQTIEAMKTIAPFLSDAGVKKEAATAALNIAERLLRARDAAKQAPKLLEPLQQVAQANAGTDLGQRASTLLQQAQSKAGQK